jgi:replicative DNA helicase
MTMKKRERGEQMDEQRITELKTMPYEEYLQTPEWTERRALMIERAGNRCQVCNSGEDLNVHHRTYERRGNEGPGDLTVLCQPCHALFHLRMKEHEGLTHIAAGMAEAMAKLETPENYLVPTGFEDLDFVIGQLQKGQFILVGSRSEQGMIPFLITLGLNAVKAKKSLAFFSSTMNKERFAEQVMAIEARIEFNRLQNSLLAAEDWENLVYAMGTLQETSFWIGDAAPTVEDIERQLEQILREQGPVDLVIVDCIELLEHGKKEYPDQRVHAVSRALKVLSRTFNIPVVAACQIPNVIANAAMKVPQLTDVKNAESYADIVLLLYFDQMYNPETERKSILDVIIEKNCNGPRGELSLFYNDSNAFIRDIERNITQEGNQEGAK